MKTKKIILCLLLILLAGSMTFFMQSCNSSDDESAVNETSITKSKNAVNKVLNSSEFKAYSAEYTEYTTKMYTIVNNTSQQKKKMIVELY